MVVPIPGIPDTNMMMERVNRRMGDDVGHRVSTGVPERPPIPEGPSRPDRAGWSDREPDQGRSGRSSGHTGPFLRNGAPAGEGVAEARQGEERRRGGSSYQHRLSARGIASGGRARSHSSEDLMTTMKRLERGGGHPSGRAGGAPNRHPGDPDVDR